MITLLMNKKLLFLFLFFGICAAGFSQSIRLVAGQNMNTRNNDNLAQENHYELQVAKEGNYKIVLVEPNGMQQATLAEFKAMQPAEVRPFRIDEKKLKPGYYTLLVTTENDQIVYSKRIKVGDVHKYLKQHRVKQ